MPGWSLNPFYTDEIDLESRSPPPPVKSDSVPEPSSSRKKRTYKRKPKEVAESSAAPRASTDPIWDNLETDSEDEAKINRKRASSMNNLEAPKAVRAATLRSFLSQRGATGYTTQRDPVKFGAYFVELRVYNSREVEHIAPDERWKQALVTLKVAADENTPVWRATSNLVRAGKDAFKNIQPIMFPNNFN